MPDSSPKFDNAPGIVVRARKDGFVAFWQCRTDLAKRGFKPQTVPLWRGVEPDQASREHVTDTCTLMQAQMLTWARGSFVEFAQFDGTVAALIRCYQIDEDSSFKKNRYRTRVTYQSLMRRIEKDYGEEKITDLRPRDMLRWHEGWKQSGIPMAHSLMRMWRGLLSYGSTMLEDDACELLSRRLSKMRFEMGKPRVSHLSADQAIAIRAEAHRRGLPSIALAQAIQFDGTLRQKDVLGEWVPKDELGPSDLLADGMKWMRGIRWNEIDASLVLHHITSKRQKLVEPDLKYAPMVLEELKLIYGYDLTKSRAMLPADGSPVIIDRDTGLPFKPHKFRELWREIATAVGVPKSVRNMDSRAGAITEALDAGAEIDDTRIAATHSNTATTVRYSRAPAERTAKVMQLRAAHRNKDRT